MQTSIDRSARASSAGAARTATTPNVRAKTSAEPPAELSDQQVKDQFRVRFRRQLLVTAIVLAAYWVAKLDSRDSHSALEMVAAAVVIAGVILSLINWRCPRCNRYLFRRIYPSTCPRCGVTFHD